MESEEVNKKHKAPHSGRKADKKKAKVQKQDQNLTARQRNPKAFAINSVVKAVNKFRRAQDLETRKQHQPKVDRTPIEPPPYVVAIIGPPGVGKTTLLRGLIHHYTGQKVASLHGPITVVSNKKCRLTLMEINGDINSLIDIAKVVDLALLFIDAKNGLDMETMEFLTICREVGMPKVLAVLTHLDTLPHKSAIKKAKDTVKKRYGMEVQKGAKVFYFSRCKEGEYPQVEVRNLARFIANIRVRPVQWRATHPYVLVDRMEDITDPKVIRAKPNCNRVVSLYGYLRGSFLKKGHVVHIPGVGDHTLSEVDFVPDDPCPLPDVIKKRSLTLKERNIYSHWSGLGGITYDKDGVYIHKTGGQKSKKSFSSMFNKMMNEERGEDEDQEDESDEDNQSENGNLLSDEEEQSENEDDSENGNLLSEDEDMSEGESDEDNLLEGGDGMPNGNEEDSMLEMDEESEDESLSEEDEAIGELSGKRKYEEESDDDVSVDMETKKPCLESDNEEEEEDELVQHDDTKNIALIKGEIDKNKQTKKKMAIEEDIFVNSGGAAKPVVDSLTRLATTEEDLTGLWISEDVIAEEAKTLLEQNKDSDQSDEDEEGEDNEDSEEKEEESEDEEKQKETEKKKKLEEKKLKTKREFDMFIDQRDTYYDQLKDQVTEQSQLNKSTFEGIPDQERVEYEGYRPGMYVRMVVDSLPCQFVENFDPDYPLIVGGLKVEESIMTYVTLKVKSHRWYCRILKSDDPLILSMGWRRFQTRPVFYTLDDNGRQRRLKYTHKYMHCNAMVWAPYTPTGAGVIGLQTIQERDGNFRIAATAEVTGSTETPSVVKKLKALGYPRKIFQKTAFIEHMFSSELEVAKFEGARIKAQSGVRGIIKKAITTFKDEKFPPGTFRATFEDKILKSDIVFMTSWVKVDIDRFYYPVLSLLQENKASWEGMKTVGHLRAERGLSATQNPDSIYTPVEHPQRIYPEIRLPKELQRQLPYRAKPKLEGKKINSLQRVAVIREKNERAVATMVKRLEILTDAKEKQELKTKIESIKKHRKRVQLEKAIREQKEKMQKKAAAARGRLGHKKK